MKKNHISLLLSVLLTIILSACTSSEKIKTLIITGQGEEQLEWMTRSTAVKTILDDAGLFATRILVTPPEGEDLSGFSPNFSKYDLVIIDYEGDAWPEKTKDALQTFLANGGGAVWIRLLSEPGSPVPQSVTFSERNDFEVSMQPEDHPITKGLPVHWLHPADVVINGAQIAKDQFQILATAPSDPSVRRSKQEPVLLAGTAGQGRVFITMLGKPDLEKDDALTCSGFIVTLQRGAEWAATGAVTQEVPFDFPTSAGTVLRPSFSSVKSDEAFREMCSYEIGGSTKFFTWLQYEIKKASGNTETLAALEKNMVKVLLNSESTAEAKKLILNELSWMGTEYCVPIIKGLGDDPELKDGVDFALKRLQLAN
jgi:hypothetical protein